MTEDKKVFAEFRGDGNAEIVGIPKRNLSEADWNELTDEQHQHAFNSGLYALVKPVINKKTNTPDAGKDAN